MNKGKIMLFGPDGRVFKIGAEENVDFVFADVPK